MRDPQRITIAVNLIQKVWEKYPDSRFFQLVSWLEWEYSKQNGGFGQQNVLKPLGEKDNRLGVTGNVYTTVKEVDLFNLEDDLLIPFLENILKR